MLSYIQGNLADILIVLVLVLVVFLIVKNLIRDKKNGVSSCGNNCAHCAMAGKCHQPVKKTSKKMKTA